MSLTNPRPISYGVHPFRERSQRARRFARWAPLAFLGVVLSSCHRSSGDDLGDPPPTTASSQSDATTDLFSDLGKSFLEGGASETGSTLVGWALGQLGIAGTDSTGHALMEIESTLQDIDAQLQKIATEISELISEEVISNCQELSSTINPDLARIGTALEKYNDIICTGNGSCADMAPPSNVPESDLMDFMDYVLDTANGGTDSMDVILDRIQLALVGGTQGGVISACINPAIPGLALPADGTFGDVDYYTRVNPVAAYYYYYQTVATLLYCEAQRYLAYVTSGAPDSDTLDPDDMKDYLLGSTDPQVVFIMNETADRMETTWSNLRNQFNLVGAPYTNADLLLHVHLSAPVLFILDMDAFTVAAGENCSDLTTGNTACTSILRGPYDLSSDPIKNVQYSNQTGHWSFANSSDLATIMTGWNGNEAWQYLALNNATTTRGFVNMSNKVLIGDEVLSGSYDYDPSEYTHETWFFEYVPFIDMNLPFNCPGLDAHLPVDNAEAIYYQIVWQAPYNVVSAQRTTHDFLQCQGTTNNDTLYHLSPVWSSPPGWAPEASSTQRGSAFHLPVIHVDGIGPNQGLQAKNEAGMWTMCTEDFEEWFDAIAPPPQFN